MNWSWTMPTAFRVSDVDGDDATPRGIQVGAKPEERSVVIDERVVGVEVGEQFLHGGAEFLEVPVEDPVPGVGALVDRDDEITTVIRDGPVECPLLLVGPMIDQFVRRLGCAQAGVKELLEKEAALEFVFLFRLVERSEERRVG